MLVSPAAIFGTIGGGQLEYMAIDKARQMLVSPSKGCPRDRESTEVVHRLDSLRRCRSGPEIGQCCGGRVEVLIRLVDAALSSRAGCSG